MEILFVGVGTFILGLGLTFRALFLERQFKNNQKRYYGQYKYRK